MSLYSDSSSRLLRDAKRASTLQTLAPYRDDLVKDILTEARHLTLSLQQVYSTISTKKEELLERNASGSEPPLSEEHMELLIRPQLTTATLYETCLRHNKRVVLAYYQHRFQRLRWVLWSLGLGSASTVPFPPTLHRLLSAQENQCIQSYSALLAQYRTRLGSVHGLDLVLGSDEDLPPTDVYIEVRVLKECGQIMTEEGTVLRLSRGSMHHVKRSLVEHLIRKGYLLHVD